MRSLTLSDMENHPHLSFFFSGAVFCVGLLAFVRRCERPFLNLLNDSLRDFLKDFRREMGVSPAPDRSARYISQG